MYLYTLYACMNYELCNLKLASWKKMYYQFAIANEFGGIEKATWPRVKWF